jgi:hypothetical protein
MEDWRDRAKLQDGKTNMQEVMKCGWFGWLDD